MDHIAVAATAMARMPASACEVAEEAVKAGSREMEDPAQVILGQVGVLQIEVDIPQDPPPERGMDMRPRDLESRR